MASQSAADGVVVKEAASQFRREFGSAPTFAARVPGRVNLIGEHIDYAGLAVLPMAVQREIRAYCRPRADATVSVCNVDPRFEPRSFSISKNLDPYPDGDWGNYAKAAAQELERRYGPLGGFDAVIESSLPVASGLSSSSALVVLVARCLLNSSDIQVPALDLAEHLAEAERFVGTRGGGMDQAICIGGLPGTASRVEFEPLRLTAVPVPSEWKFVVASSLVRAEKSGSMREAYNSRRRDCEEALHAVIAHLDTPRATFSYRSVLEELTPFDLEDILDHVLDGELMKRFRHVVTEATRVSLAEEAMLAGDLERFGTLLSDSHVSLRDDFEVSCDELDLLTDIATSSGAAGARLTGAGFGGCVLALAPVERVDMVLDGLREQFYQPRGIASPQEAHLFVAEPSAGASVLPIS
jgi:galactokinase